GVSAQRCPNDLVTGGSLRAGDAGQRDEGAAAVPVWKGERGALVREGDRERRRQRQDAAHRLWEPRRPVAPVRDRALAEVREREAPNAGHLLHLLDAVGGRRREGLPASAHVEVAVPRRDGEGVAIGRAWSADDDGLGFATGVGGARPREADDAAVVAAVEVWSREDAPVSRPSGACPYGGLRRCVVEEAVAVEVTVTSNVAADRHREEVAVRREG